MNRTIMLRILAWVLKLGLGAILVLAGWPKFNAPADFVTEIENYQLWPALAPYIALCLPSTEMVLGAALIFLPPRNLWLAAAALATSLLLLVFTVAVTTVVVRGIDISCGCFGGDSANVTLLTIARNIGLIGSGVLLYALAIRAAATRSR